MWLMWLMVFLQTPGLFFVSRSALCHTHSESSSTLQTLKIMNNISSPNSLASRTPRSRGHPLDCVILSTQTSRRSKSLERQR